MIKKKKSPSYLRSLQVDTAHGRLLSPIFMPDATRAFIKGLSASDLEHSRTEALVVNTFHLYLQPGLEILKKAGGVHKFMNWSAPLLSDSGGFQVFSLVHRRQGMGKVDDNQVTFKSPLDGSWHELSPEKSIQIQFDLGVDLMVCLDDCPPNDWPRPKLEKAVERSITWARRCKAEYLRQLKKRKLTATKKPILMAVVQGGDHEDLRYHCAQELIKIGFDAYGFGARPIDEQGNFLADTLYKTASYLPDNSLRFALGIGLPEDIYRCYLMGWDMFDCVIPTREGRHAKLFYFKAKFKGFKKIPKKMGPVDKFPDFYHSINISQAIFKKDFSAINPNSRFPELRNYTKAYLHHLFRLKEPFGQKLATLNNLEFYQNLILELKKINRENNK